MSSPEPDRAPVIPLRRAQASASPPPAAPAPARLQEPAGREPGPPGRRTREPLLRDVVGQVLRRERLDQERTLKEVAGAARISMPYLSEIERGRKEPSSEVLAAAARALGLSLADLLKLSQGELARHPGAGPGRADSGRVQMSLAA